jgi:glycine/serine hydroxymethyltransferase
VVDQVETLASEHARELFGAQYAYVQPHSGIDANLVAYWAILAKRVESPFLEAAGAGHVNDCRRRAGPSCGPSWATSACWACPSTPVDT